MPQNVELWIASTGAAWKLHRLLCSLYPLLSARRVPVHVVLTASGNAAADDRLFDVCCAYPVEVWRLDWAPIVKRVVEILSKMARSRAVVLMHDDVMFPTRPLQYLIEITKPILESQDVAIVGGKVWDAFYGRANAFGDDEFPGKAPYPREIMAVSCVHSSCMAIRPDIARFANLKAEFDFERVLSYGAWQNGLATLYWPTTQVLWHEKGGTVDHYHKYPSIAGYVVDITRRSDWGTGFDEKWHAAYGESPRESLDAMGEMAFKWAGSELKRFRETASGAVYGCTIPS